jgi:hypothetical protein
MWSVPIGGSPMRSVPIRGNPMLSATIYSSRGQPLYHHRALPTPPKPSPPPPPPPPPPRPPSATASPVSKVTTSMFSVPTHYGYAHNAPPITVHNAPPITTYNAPPISALNRTSSLRMQRPASLLMLTPPQISASPQIPAPPCMPAPFAPAPFAPPPPHIPPPLAPTPPTPPPSLSAPSLHEPIKHALHSQMQCHFSCVTPHMSSQSPGSPYMMSGGVGDTPMFPGAYHTAPRQRISQAPATPASPAIYATNRLPPPTDYGTDEDDHA